MRPAGPAEGDQVAIYPVRRRLVAAAVVTVGFAVACLLLLLFPATFRVGPLERAILAVGIVVFAAGSLFIIDRLLRPRPILVISAAGIVDGTSLPGVGLVRWDELGRLVVYRRVGQRFLAVVPVSLDPLLARQPGARRWLLRVNATLMRAPICIPERLLPMSLEELLAVIERFRRRHDWPA